MCLPCFLLLACCLAVLLSCLLAYLFHFSHCLPSKAELRSQPVVCADCLHHAIVDMMAQLGADLVVIFNDNTEVCGVAWMPVRQDLAFSACDEGLLQGLHHGT